jgi:Nucleotidyl transferase AbiEii toxin, Type IV TA system
MHLEILEKNQLKLLPFLKKYKRNYYLVGGTAISLFIGHRKSIDFDLFTIGKVNSTYIKKQIVDSGFSSHVLHALKDQIHFIVHEVKLTFFEYPFTIVANVDVNGIFRIPDLLTLAAMKAFALGGRGKWKDYVDLYFIIKDYYTPQQISVKASELFTDVFNPTLFRKQLSYFGDINYSEQVEYMPGFEVPESEIKAFLVDAALTGF